MDIKPLLQFQLNGSFKLLGELLEDITDDEWRSRAFPGANRLGFTVWHCARTIDWAVNCVLRASPELADLSDWRDLNVDHAAFGAGAPKTSADAVAVAVPRARVLEYVRALQSDSVAWLAGIAGDELSGAVDLGASNAKKPEYMVSAVHEELEDLNGIPKWQFLARPCISHVRVHYGEVRAELEAVRAAATA